MKKLFYSLLLLVTFATVSLAQSQCVDVEEIDGSPKAPCIRQLKVTNGTLSCPTTNRCTLTISGGGGSGTVTSVAFTGGLISVANPTTAAALTVAGTSGGVPYFSSASTWASSGALTSNALVLGGGAGAAPKVAAGLVTDGTSALTLGVAGASVGAINFNNATSGTITLQPVTGALGTVTLSLPATTGTLALTSALPAGANPTGTVGLTAVNGVATTFLRSDGAPALDQGIVPTWTGAHTFASTIALSSTTASLNKITQGAAINIGTTSTDGIILQNTTAAAAGAQQYSPRLHLTGQGWKTNATAASQSVDWIQEVQPVQAAANPTSLFVFSSAVNGGAYTRQFAMSTAVANTIYGDNSTPFLTLSSGNGSQLCYSTNSCFVAGGAAHIDIGGTNKLQVSSTSLGLAGTSFVIGFTNGSTGSGTQDSFIRRGGAAATIAFGDVDAATAIAQTSNVQNVVAGTTNTAGATRTFIGSLGTSQGTPGIIDLQTGGLIAASGTTQQTAVSRTVLGASKVLTDNTLTTLVNVTDASNTVASGIVDYTVEVFDGTDLQMETGSFIYQVANKGGAFSLNTITPPTGFPKNATTSGTLTVTWGITGANPALLQITADSSLTPSTGYPRVTYSIRNLTQQAIAVQ